ncbi:carboxymuconolactone decarboxylase family protein [Spirosoma validum]|uniref:Peroxidase-related enzyme n=1 Tax=Spirosoma validum TaxID=2771355 RepID=A0A927GFA1_9BACT|nr:peroxidase-related enzyme [Spirosoma validum]MBD2755619.1 peroxidase-related enzyme [Spirosoma validum]
MAHIQLPEGLPGIRGPMAFSPETTKPLNLLVDQLLWSADNTLSQGERELIATYVSSENDCQYCQTIHGAIASQWLGDTDWSLVQQVKQNPETAPISEKMKALLAIAGSVQKGGKHVTPEQIERAKSVGATDKEIHDTVLIAAAFCMFNRYVDGLATWMPDDPSFFRQRAVLVCENGYSAANPKPV